MRRVCHDLVTISALSRLHEHERLILHRGMSEGEETPVIAKPAAQVVPSGHGMDALVLHEAVEERGGRRVPSHREERELHGVES